MPEPETYLPIPVDVAKKISWQFDKAMVVVIGYDLFHERTHVATYGKSPSQKLLAAQAGERCAVLLGGDLAEAQTHEDFRQRAAAAAAARIEELTEGLREIRDLMTGIARNDSRIVAREIVDRMVERIDRMVSEKAQ